MPHRHRRVVAPVYRFVEGAIWALFILGAIGAAIALVWPGVAAAQDGAAGFVYDFGPIIADILSIVAPSIATIVGLLGVWILGRIGSWLRLAIDDRRRAALETGLVNGVSLALERLGDRARGGIPVDVKHEAIFVGATYAERAVPDAIRHFGITEERLQEMVEARMSGLLLGAGDEQRVSRPLPANSAT